MVDTSTVHGWAQPEPLVISRVFPAPKALVFRAWSSADHLKRWFSPVGYTVPEAQIDFRTGGVCAICMRSPEGQDFWSRGSYLEIAPPDRLVFTLDVANGEAKGFTAHTTVQFEDTAGGTRMTVHQRYTLFDPEFTAPIRGAPEGWSSTLDKLEREVARLSATPPTAVHGAFTVERTYPASPAQVFHALTDPSAKARWFGGGEAFEVLERIMDVTPGGKERLRGRWQSGLVTTFDAVYFDVVTDRRLVYAYEMHLDDKKISVSLATMDLQPAGTGTRLVVTEQGAFLDGYEDEGSREHGTGGLLDRLGASLLA